MRAYAWRYSEFWHVGRLSTGQFEGGPDRCTVQVSFREGESYLVLRDAEGLVTAAELLRRSDPLVDAVRTLVADPGLGYGYQPTVMEYLFRARALWFVEAVDCSISRVQVLRVLRPPPVDRFDFGMGSIMDLRRGLTPGLSQFNCTPGAQYLVEGSIFNARVHPIAGGKVQFQDRWMQLRFSGGASLSTSAVEAAVGWTEPT